MALDCKRFECTVQILRINRKSRGVGVRPTAKQDQHKSHHCPTRNASRNRVTEQS
jgi:hypothetical protein